MSRAAESVPLSAGKKVLLGAVLLVGVPVGVFTLVEGGSSLMLLTADMRPTRQLTERAHTDYDTLLGWVNRRNAHVPDLYGPGRHLSTNSQRFRGHRDVGVAVPPQRVRIVCSGDSYTLGWGVADDDTWCARLERNHPELETVNMGQGGYGVDQVYLWYRRDGQQLDHHLHVVAFILYDFERMLRPTFLGFGKPVLKLQGDSLVVDNVPVPRWSYVVPGLARYLDEKRGAFAELRAAQLMARVGRRLTGRGAEGEADNTLLPVVARIVRDLRDRNQRKGSTLVLMYLPTPSDRRSTRSDWWRERIAAEAARLRLEFVDLVPVFRQLPPDSMPNLFIRSGPGLAHYSPSGNQWVAEELYARLSKLPPLRPTPAPR